MNEQGSDTRCHNNWRQYSKYIDSANFKIFLKIQWEEVISGLYCQMTQSDSFFKMHHFVLYVESVLKIGKDATKETSKNSMIMRDDSSLG